MSAWQGKVLISARPHNSTNVRRNFITSKQDNVHNRHQCPEVSLLPPEECKILHIFGVTSLNVQKKTTATISNQTFHEIQDVPTALRLNLSSSSTSFKALQSCLVSNSPSIYEEQLPLGLLNAFSGRQYPHNDPWFSGWLNCELFCQHHVLSRLHFGSLISSNSCRNRTS